jgi:hypothetical protein
VASPDSTLVGDYYGRHDHCLYRITWEHEGYWQARCTSPAATPADDVFGPAYQTTEAQLRWLLAFGSLIPATF